MQQLSSLRRAQTHGPPEDRITGRPHSVIVVKIEDGESVRMQDGDFVHLRVHTAYSLSEGAIRIKDLSKLCTEQAMPAVAITDTNNLFGGMEFSSSMRQAGVQPIIGCQLSMTLTQATLRQGQRGSPPPGGTPWSCWYRMRRDTPTFALLALAYGAEPIRPTGALGSLCAHADGLILLTGGPEGPRPAVAGGPARGRRGACGAVARGVRRSPLYRTIATRAGERGSDQPALLAIAKTADLPIVATNDAYFTTPDMYEAHDALLCIRRARTWRTPTVAA